ncbi:hypothetical protein [Pseudogulbenkiania subflava]|uniref:Uncharacterized protein n=1 Tax=Pseudogulbenkiania subflava DSM 22618 TaxID=1123014 RepID=A0A1Y6BPE0_9NEIS|nr:hypothetical protein [Pseudogulbenkiania subflava]SMF13868.1 hypothetical protein SAMN02745746_01516 [Pseudogulbenkiania subflava DSM 22618]
MVKECRWFKGGAITLCLVSSLSCNASEYGFPLSLRLGAGVTPSDPTDSFPYCFDFKTRLIPGSAGSSLFRTSLIKTRTDFLRELSVSASAAGKYAFFSGAASGSLDEKYSFSSDSLTWIVYLQTDLGKSEVYDESLKAFASQLIESKNFAQFATRCGQELITQERRKASVSAIFSISNISQEQRKTLEGKFSGEANTAIFSVEASTSFRNFVKEAAKTSRITVDVVTVGGSGAADLAALFTDYSDLAAISQILRTYTAKLSFDNSKATSYQSTKMTRYGWGGNVVDFSIADIALSDYYITYRDIDIIKRKAYDLLNMAAQGQIELTTDQTNTLKKAYSDSDALIAKIVQTARACRDDEKKCISAVAFTAPSVAWPKLDPVGTLVQRKKTVECNESPGPISFQVKFQCSQTSVFRGVAKWANISNVDAIDRFGQRYTPVVSAESIDLRSAYEEMNKQYGGALTEGAFLELVTGETIGSIAAAKARGWSIREMTLSFLFGAQSANTGGLQTALDFTFFDGKGNRTGRQAFMY